MDTRTRCTALVAGFGRPGMRDLDFGRQLVRYLQGLSWPDGVVVEDLSYAAPLVLHRLRELDPSKVVLVGAAARGPEAPGQVRRYRLRSTSLPPEEVHRHVQEAAQGSVDLDHTLAFAGQWGGLPADTVVIEVEPADCSFGLGFSEELGASIDELVGLLRAELGAPAGPGGPEPDLASLLGPGPCPGPPVPAPSGVVPGAPDLGELAQHARAHGRRLLVQAHRSPAPPDGPTGRADLTVAARSRPWGVKLDHGSDWTDVLPLAHGWYGVVAGDAPGRGIEAAAAREELRAAVRAYALVATVDPARVLGLLDEFVRATGVGVGTTLAYLAVHPATGEVRMANAGHCPPLRRGARGGASFLDGGGSGPLGTAGAPRPQAAYVLPPASTIVLYTDGLVRSRSRSMADGLRVLRDAAAAAPEPPADLCDHVVAACTVGLRRDDDLSILAVRLAHPGAPEPRPA